jgi:hypothetical protein
MALTDVQDVGRFVSRIIADPQTLNKYVFAYGEVLTQNQAWRLLEKASGETIPRNPVSVLVQSPLWLLVFDMWIFACFLLALLLKQ